MCKVLRALMFVALVFFGVAALSAQPQKSQTTAKAAVKKPAAKVKGITNQDVVSLAKAGFTDDLIVAQIKQTAGNAFDLSTVALLELKTAGVSERVIAVMLGMPDPGSKPTVAVPAAGNAPTQVGMVFAPPLTKSVEGREAGIYVLEGDKYTPLEPTVFSGGKTGGVLLSGLTYGIKKMKWKAVVRSPRAQQRLSVSNPVFYFYFERQSSGLSNTGLMGAMLGASSPNEFVLARMDQKSKDRELIVGEAGTFGASSGTRSEDIVDLLIERIQPGVYKVTTKSVLTPGEYCFFYAAGASTMMSAGTGKLFDFGVDSGAQVAKK